jgi:hypothetical protein
VRHSSVAMGSSFLAQNDVPNRSDYQDNARTPGPELLDVHIEEAPPLTERRLPFDFAAVFRAFSVGPPWRRLVFLRRRSETGAVRRDRETVRRRCTKARATQRAFGRNGLPEFS